MGFRFHKSVKILPGLRVHLSKSGLSTSVGKPGATVNIGHGRVLGSTGIPGTGLGYRKQWGLPKNKALRWMLFGLMLALLAYKLFFMP